MTPDQIAAMVATAVPLDPPPTEADIDSALQRIVGAFAIAPDIADQARKTVHARYKVTMEVGQTLRSEDHQPWLADRRRDIEPFYWRRYNELLLQNGWSPLVAGTLDRTTDELLDLLGDPEKQGEWKRRGLVVGDVQSGKTASYAALICKAADAGYRMVVLLTGTLENVRRQTQERLDASFIGLDSRDFLTTGSIGTKTYIGVGKIDQRRDGIVFTSRDHDFRKNSAQALNLSLGSVKEPVLVVSKKNKSVLNRLAGWLRARNAGRGGRIDLPMLLIDDEADNASINTRQKPGETTAINQGIRDLLSLFTRSSYVGFTATPFANIFIDPISTDSMIGDDLFPRDFIHVLEPPSDYIGMTRIFSKMEPDAADQSASPMIQEIKDEGTWLPSTHKKYDDVSDLPASLREAIGAFLLASAIRDVRQVKAGAGGGPHRSMLVNVSRFTDIQNKVAGLIHLELDRIRTAVRLHGALPPARAEAQSAHIAALAEIYRTQFVGIDVGWEHALAALHDAISPMVVRAVNQSTGSGSLDYSPTTAPQGLRVIAVGGNSLSRGLTLEGLSTSYFLRNAKAYDTLLQMGRWFGYRPGYADLCRLWITGEAELWYRHVTEATVELKRDFTRMRKRRATPREFGLRVRNHPDTLVITARNKMASGINVVTDTRGVSLAGSFVESARLYGDRERNLENLETIEKFVGELVTTKGTPSESPHGGAVLWSSVPGSAVATFVDSFRVHPLNHAFQSDTIAERILSWSKKSTLGLATWNVGLLTTGQGKSVELSALPGVRIPAKLRAVGVRDHNSLLVSGRSARVGSLRDVYHGLPLEALEAVRSAADGKDPTEGDYRQAMQMPLLLLYLIEGKAEQEAGGARPAAPTFLADTLLTAISMHFPGTVDPNADENLVSYRLNKVAQAELLGADFDEEDGADEDLDAND